MFRILILTTATGYGGSERSMEMLAPELAKRADVLVLTGNIRHRCNLKAAARRAGVRLPVWHLPLDGNRRGSGRAVLVFLVSKFLFRPDVILTNTELSAMIASRAERFGPVRGGRTWIYVRDFMWFDLREVFTRMPGAEVLIPGPAVLERRDYLSPWVEPAAARRVHIVPDMTVIAEEASDAGMRRDYVLHLATVSPLKGHDHLIRTAEKLSGSGRRLRIRSRGVTRDAKLRRALERQIEEAGIGGPGGFELLEHAEDPEDELRGCSCVVVTSISRNGGPETFGRTVIEAWAHGRPVVAFAAGSMPHLIAHGEDGLLVAEGDEDGLAEALWRLHSDPGLAARLGARGREKVRRHYTLEKVSEQLMTLFKDSCGAEIV